MINDAKIDFQLRGDTDVERIRKDLKRKHDPYQDIVSTISTLNEHSKKFYIVIQVTDELSIAPNAPASQLVNFHEPLTKREEEVYGLAMGGLCNKSIAEKLFISVETVKSHRKSIVRKAGVRRMEEIKDLILEGKNFVK
jgi:DNA-binding NarL/FixJ family response regulator